MRNAVVDYPAAPQEKELVTKITDILAEGLDLKAIKSEVRGSNCLCLNDDRTDVKVEIRNARRRMRIEAWSDYASNVKLLLRANQISFVDHGSILDIVTPWQQGVHYGLDFPNDLKMFVQNFGPVKIVPYSVSTVHRYTDSLTGFMISVDIIPIAHIFACYEERFVDSVSINSNRIAQIRAICNLYDFPFKEFIIRELDQSRPNATPSEMKRRISEEEGKLSVFISKLKDSPKKRSEWGEMTNPRNHSPEKFMYIVHALTRNGFSNFPSKEAEREYLMRYDGRDPLNKPDLFVKRSGISCSVIAKGLPGVNDRTAIWGDSGFILDVPPENIRTAFPGDTMSIIAENAENYDANLPSPTEILMRTREDLWNEVFIAGVNENTGSAIRIAGTFVCINVETGKPFQSYWPHKIVDFSEKHSLPLIKFPQPKDHREPHLSFD